MGLTEQPSSEASERAVSPDGPQRRVIVSAAVMISSRVNNVFGGKSNPPSDRKRSLRNLCYLLYMTQGFCQVLHGKLREIFVKKHGSILTPVRFVHVQGMSAAMRRRLSSLHMTHALEMYRTLFPSEETNGENGTKCGNSNHDTKRQQNASRADT